MKPNDANYLRAMIEMAESAGLTTRSSRGPTDKPVRDRLRRTLDRLGVDRTGKALAHPVDSYCNPYFNPNAGGYILLDAATNRSFGAQAIDFPSRQFNWLRGVAPGREIRHLFFGFPSYEQAPPVVEPWQLVPTNLAPPPRQRRKAR